MLRIDIETKTISINRGDRGTIRLRCKNGMFKKNDKIKFSIVDYGNYNNVLLQKEYIVLEEKDYIDITLNSDDTRISDVISSRKQYWYEFEYNDDMTIIGYDENKAKKFILYPEAPTKERGN